MKTFPFLLLAATGLTFLYPARAVYAQTFPVDEITYAGENFSFPGNSALSLYQDSDQFLWLGVYQLGLVRYDGREMKVYGLEGGVPGKVDQILEDRRGHLWLATSNSVGSSGGVSYSSAPVINGGILPDDLRFRYANAGEDLLRGDVADLALDSFGQIWGVVDSFVQVHRWVGDTLIEKVRLSRPEHKALRGRPLSVLPVADGSVWLTYQQHGVYHLTVPPGGGVRYLDSLTFPETNPLSFEYVDPSGRLWGYTSLTDSLVVFDPASGQRRYLEMGDRIEDIDRLDEGTLVVTTEVSGLVFVDPDELRIKHRLGAPQGMTAAALFGTEVGRAGNLWVGSMDGVYRIPFDFRAHRHYTDRSYGGAPPLLAQASINSVNANFWIRRADGTRDTVTVAGLIDGMLVVPRAGAPYTVGPSDGLPISTILGAVQDEAGGIYLTSLQDEIAYLRPGGEPHPLARQSGPLPAFAPGYSVDVFPIPRGLVPSLLRLPGATDQRLYLGQNNYLVTFTEDKKQLWIGLPYRQNTSYPLALALDADDHLHAVGHSGWVRSIRPFTQQTYAELTAADKLTPDGQFYVARATAGLFAPVEPVVGGDTLRAFSSQAFIDDEVWLAQGNRLFVCAPDDGTVRRTFTLPSEHYQVTAMAYDATRNIVWTGTSGGLYGIRRSDLTVAYHFLQGHGLLASENWSPVGLDVTHEGVVYQGTSDGLQRVDPARFRPDTFPRPLYVVESAFDSDPWGRNALEVSYAMLSYRDDGSDIRYRTRLVGYDDEWSEPTRENSLRYTNLGAFVLPKTYQVEVSATDYLGNTYTSSAGLYPVTVDPPLYYRWWALLLYLALAVVLLRAYTRYRLRQQERTLRLQEAATIRQQRDEIAAKNAENETLLKEIHHRVKNNLEVVSGLLELHGATLDDGDALAVMRDGQSRVESMSLLHQKLYRGDDLAAVEMQEYLRDLTESIGDTYDVDGEVRFAVAAPADFKLDVDTAVPVGLIVNELVTNSLKYAFPPEAAEGKDQLVQVRLARQGEQTVLSVSDNGSGKVVAGAQGTGFGDRLVRLLTQQLEGTLYEENSGGLTTTVVF